MSFHDRAAASKRRLARHFGGPVTIRRIATGEPIEGVRARFEMRVEVLPHGGRGVAEREWMVVEGSEVEAPIEPGDEVIRSTGPRLRVLAGGQPHRRPDGRVLAYHVPVAEVA